MGLPTLDLSARPVVICEPLRTPVGAFSGSFLAASWKTTKTSSPHWARRTCAVNQ